VEPAPGAQFLDALQVLRVLWEAHSAGEVVSERRLHGVVKVPIYRIEAILETMNTAHWAGRVSNGWSLTHDVATIRVADVYHLFVFRRDARFPARQSGQELDRYALSITDTFEANLGLSVDELFQRTSSAAAPEGAPQRGAEAPVSGDATKQGASER
jgi:hypothetical protein